MGDNNHEEGLKAVIRRKGPRKEGGKGWERGRGGKGAPIRGGRLWKTGRLTKERRGAILRRSRSKGLSFSSKKHAGGGTSFRRRVVSQLGDLSVKGVPMCSEEKREKGGKTTPTLGRWTVQFSLF